MLARALAPILPSLFVLLVACGGSTMDDAKPIAEGGALSVCPVAAPSANTSCARESLQCEYGNDPRRNCHSMATCRGGKWEVTSAQCPQLPLATCPATRGDAQGNACNADNAICVYEYGLSCTCTTCPNPYPICQQLKTPVWACQAPSSDSDCPNARPNLGTTCAKEKRTCSYGCEPDNNLVCSSGMWQRDASHVGGCNDGR